MKRIKRLFSIMLAIIMLFSLHSFVYPVLAEELIEPPMNEELLEKEISEAEILSEVIEKLANTNTIKLITGWKSSPTSKRPLDLFILVEEQEH